MKSGAGTGIAAAAGVVLVLVSLMLMLFDDASRTVDNCPAGLAQPGGAVLAAAVAPPSAGAPSAMSGAPAVPGRRSMPMAENTFTISDTFGSRGGEHRGVDMAAPGGTPIYAALDGTVVAAGPASGFGNWIVIDSLDERGRPISTVYGHMWTQGVGVHAGESVKAGQPIGAVGSAGESSGPHLHFEVVPGGRFTGGRQIDPVPWWSGSATPIPGTAAASAATTARSCPQGFGSQGGELDPTTVPPELARWFQQAGSLCPQVSASLLAAQAQQESGFRRGQTSPSGAEGLTQFLPGTAASINPLDGRPMVIDADGNGRASVWDDGDAIIGQGRYMCYLADTIDRWKADGQVSGDTTALTLAAYNAGPDAVRKAGGQPPFRETDDYVRLILSSQSRFRSTGAAGRFVSDANSAAGPQIVAAARQWLGTPYAWGGGGPNGPSQEGIDCSGLTSGAVSAASNGRVILPRTSEQQWSVGVEVDITQVQPGDLVFGAWNSSTGLPGHVGIAVGGGRMIHAPGSGDPGDSVREAPIAAGMRARRVM
ncbi:peptidoglycan DD-metalloendopeptidase family protein [Nocardia takedensis]|uniref:peptidoglycan DD-metalloendopeptidase family protein n=1 Tax=Nocardia takedensis TaxID=259390 RepID=UPI003F761B56